MASFTDYYKGLTSGSRSVPQVAAPQPQSYNLNAFKPAPAAKTDSKEPQDFLSWLTDIISRPLYSVTNVAQQGLNEIEKAPETARKLQQGDTSGLFGALGNIATAGTRGFLSTDRADKATTSGLIERGTDVVGERFDPKYKDREDNVDPLIKGVVGFAGDVALDPLSYLTLGGSAALKAGAKGASLVEDAVKASDDVVDTVTITPVPERLRPSESRAAVKEVERVEQVDEKALKIADQETTALAKEIDKAPLSVREQLMAQPESAEAAQSLLKMLAEPKAQKFAATAPDLEKALDTTFDDYLDTLELNPKYAESPVALGASGEDILGRDARAALADGDVKLQLDEGYQQFLKDEAKRRKVPVAKTYETPQSLFEALSKTENGRARLETVLGPEVVRALSGTTKNFESKVQEMLSVFDDATGLDNIVSRANMADAQRLMRHIGVDATATNRALKESALQDALRRGEFTPEEMLVRDSLVQALPEQFKKGLDPEASPFQTKKQNTRRSDTQLGEGTGINVTEINQYNQWNLRNSIVQGAKKALGESGRLRGSGAAYARTVRDAALPLLRTSDEFLTTRGFFLNMGVSGKVNRLIPLSTADVYRIAAAASTSAGGHLAETDLRAFWNAKTLIPETNLFDAMPVLHSAAEAGRLGPEVREQLRAILGNTRKRNLKSGEFDNPANNGGHFGYKTHNQQAGAQREIDALNEAFFTAHPELRAQKNLYSVKLVPGAKGGSYVSYPSGRLKEDYLDLLMHPEFVDALVNTVASNRAARVAKLGDDVASLSKAQLDEILSWIDDPNIVAEGIRDLGTLRPKIREQARAEGASVPAAKVAREVVVAAVGEKVVRNSEKLLDVESKLEKGDDIRKARLDMAENGAEEYMDDVVPEKDPFGAPAINTDDPWEIYGKTQAGLANIIDPLGRSFNPRYGRGEFYELTKRPGAIAAGYMDRIGHHLGRAQKAHRGVAYGSTTVLQEAFRTIQQVGVGPVIDDLAPAVDDLRPVVNELFDVSGENALLGNAYIRNSGDVDEINDAFGWHGITEKARFDVDAARLPDGTIDNAALAEQWRTWDIEDPVDFLHRAHAAVLKIATNTTLANSLVKEGTRLGFAGSAPQKGWVRLTTSGKSSIVGRIPEGTYFDPEAANWIHRLEDELRESKRVSGGFGDFLYNYYMPVQQAWKSMMTIYRPGHHLRNLVGDSSSTWFAEGSKGYLKSAKNTFKVLAYMGRNEAFDFRSALQQLDITQLPKAGDLVVNTKHVKLTVAEVENLAYRLELRPTYRQSEDLFRDQEGTSFFSKLVSKAALRGTKAEEVAGGISQNLDHYGRMQHFLQILEKHGSSGKFRNAEQLIEYAQKRVKKYHPSAGELTAFERKYLTPIIPFYTWARGILPAVAETVLMNPGRVNTINKAGYNAAIAMGVDPYSLDDPFPEDQLFPSFLKEGAYGPQWGNADTGYWGVEPGFMIQDVLNSYAGGGNPIEGVIRGAAGSVSPLIRTPIELLAGAQLQTGAPINDTSDYLDSQIPFVNYISNISGRSVTGGLEEQYQVEKGNKTPVDQATSFLNYLTGAGLTNYSRENFINYAEIEKRDREAGK